tara:strand:- start:29 stop:418 length:390 start_codon:yes stop_codon:yes gene_type:complete
MASILKVDDLRGNTAAGDITITSGSATMNMQDGIAIVTIAASDAAVLYRSLNVSSGVDEGTGDYKYNLTNALSASSAENCVSTCALGYQTIIRIKTAEASTSVVDIESINTSSSQTNAAHGVAIHGDLA